MSSARHDSRSGTRRRRVLGAFVGPPQVEDRVAVGIRRERGEIGVGERVALFGKRLGAPPAQLPPVPGVGRDEVALGEHVRPHEVGDARSEQRLDERRAAPVVVGVVVGVRDVGDVVHEAGDRQLVIVGVL